MGTRTIIETSVESRDGWLRAWCQHDVVLMNEVHRQHASAIHLRARAMCGPDDAADVVQEVLLRLWRNPGGFDPAKGTLRTYLLVLTRGVALDMMRSGARRRRRDQRAMSSLTPTDALGERSTLDLIVLQEMAARVNTALAQLDPRHRRAIQHRFYDGVSFGEAARRDGIPEDTAKSRVRHGLLHMRPALLDLQNEVQEEPRFVREVRSSNPVPRIARGGVAFALAVALASIAAACSSTSVAQSRTSPNDGRITIATTVAPITSIVSNIVGDRADVTGIVPEGTNSHTFEPKPSVAELLTTVDVVYVNGLFLEEPTKDLAVANIPDDAEIVELGTLTIPESDYIYDFSFPRADGRPNPHLWTDPTLAREFAQIVKDDMSRRDPANAQYYAANYARFSAIIDELDAAMRSSFATVPLRELLTYHDAYAYFAKTYDWQVIGAIQISDFEDPTPSEVADLIDQVRTSGVPAIFGSEVFPSPVLEQIGREAGVTYVDELRDDDLPGQPGDAEHSWLGLMRFDYITMTEALGGDASALRAVQVRDAAIDKARYPQ